MTETTLYQDMAAAIAAYEKSWSQSLNDAGLAGVTLNEASVLSVVQPDAKSMVQIAAARDVSKQAIQSQLQNLAKRGLVKITPSTSDARIRLVSLTDMGQQIVTSLEASQAQLDTRLQERLGPERLKNFRNMLGQVTSGVV